MRLSSAWFGTRACRSAAARRRRQSAVVLAALSVTGLLAGCGSFGQAGAASLPVVKVGVVPGVDNATLYLAKKLGYFTRAGVDVKIVDFTSVASELHMLSTGQVNVAAGDYGDLFARQPALQKSAFKILADGYDAAPGVAEIMTMPNSPVQTPAALANVTIGAPDTDVVSAPAGSPSSLLIASATSVLIGDKVNSSVVNWKNMPQAQEISQLVSGQLKAILVTEPYVYQAQQAGAVELLDVCSGATAGIPLSGYFTSASWARNNPQAVAAFRKGLARANADASMPGPIQSVLPQYAHYSPQEANLITTGVYPLSTVAANIQRTADTMWSVGMIPQQLDVGSMIAR
ncbi:MAG TPA: ABC transporter substrate-binding protein [Streptosporangiaceae bacterium]